MSDPYLDFNDKNDLSNIQVNIFHVKNTLRGLSPSERESALHSECYVFNPLDSKNPSVPNIKCKPKVVKDTIYLTDTIEILLTKIAEYCVDTDISGKRIFAWIDMNPKKEPSLQSCLPLGIEYTDLDTYMNLYLDRNYDDRFCNTEGEEKRQTRFSSDMYSSYKRYYDMMKDIRSLKPNTNIYFCTLDDAISYSKNHMKEMNDIILLNGYLKKYFPLLTDLEYDDSDYHNKCMSKIRKIQEFKFLQREYIYKPISCRPDTLIYENRVDENSIDLFKIFKEFGVDEKIPYIKIYIDNYLDSCMKLDRNSIYNEYSTDKKTVTKEIFEKWNRSIMIHNGFTMPERIDMINTLSFILYDKLTTNYATMILYSNGKVKLYCGSMMRISEFKNNIVIDFVNRCNGIIRNLNKKEVSQSDKLIPLVYKFPYRIDCSYIYELPDYNQNILVKPFRRLYTDFTVIEDSQDEPLHLLYNKSSGFHDPKKLYSFISLLKKRNTEEAKIIQILNNRYGLPIKTSKEEIENWERVFQGKFNRNDFKDIGISIIIQKVLDRVKVSFIGIGGFDELHECMNTINFVMGLYKSKRIDKESLPTEYNELFKKGGDKELREYKKTDELFTEVVHKDLPPKKGPLSSSIDSMLEDKISEKETDIQLKTDEVHEEDEESDDDELDDDESDEEDDYGQISSSSSNDSNMSSSSSRASGGGVSDKQKGGGTEIINQIGSGDVAKEVSKDESKYPNKRYYIKRLEQRDPRLIKYKSKSNKDGYAYKCQAAQDKIPIVLTKEELDEIDHKTGFKNAGVSYSKAIQIQGGDRPELYYICPKFWDRKHQIPLDPLNKIHPIEKIDYTPFVYSREMKDDDHFILERTGRPANRKDQDSYWNRNEKDKNDIFKYNVQFILDDVHPDLLALPCCGKKPVKYDISEYVNVLIQNPDSKSYWEMGKITDEINSKDEYPISIKGSKPQYFHISLLKPFKGSNDRLSYDFPLKKDSNGHIHPILKDFFHVRREDPILNKSENNGFFRKGIQQGPDSFLNCLDLIHRENRNNPLIKRDSINLDRFKKNILQDINDKNFDIYSVGGGSFVQYFRDENIDNKDKIKESVLANFERYLYSNEPKDDKVLSPLIKSICRLPNNSTFEGYRFNLIVFEELNEKILIREPIGKFKTLIDKGYPFAYIFKKDMNYEPLIYHYGSSNYGYVLNEADEADEKIKKGDDIIFTDTIAKCVTVKKDIIKILVKDSEEVLEIEKEGIQKYNMRSVNDIINKEIDKSETRRRNRSEYMTEGDLNRCMESLNFKHSKKGYIDTYNKLCMIEYREKIGKGFKRMIFPIKPKPYNKEESEIERVSPIKECPHIEIEYCIKTLMKVDKRCNELFNDKYVSYLNDYTKVIVNYKDKNIGLLLKLGIIIPLIQKKYLMNKYKYDTIINTNLLSLQNDYLLGEEVEDEFNEYFNEYNKENETLYQDLSKTYLTIIRNKALKSEVLKIIQHPVKLDIHKRWELLDAFSQNDSIILKDKRLKQFIEILLINDLDELNKIFIHNFISLKDIKKQNQNNIDIERNIYHIDKLIEKEKSKEQSDKTILTIKKLEEQKIKLKQKNVLILTMKDIRDDYHETYFVSKSGYIRDISYYDEYNSDIHKRFLRREKNKKHVSFETKYPSSLRRLFSQSIRVLKNIVSEETTDFKLLEQSLTTIDPSYNDIYLREMLMNALKENSEAYKYENLLLDNRYKSNDELLSDLEDPNYLITSYDLKLLSKELGIGFMLYTNRYSNKPIKFQTHIVIHKELIKYSLKELSLPMICFYQDEDSLKPIEIEESLLTDLQQMMRSTEFKKVAMKTYRV